MSRTLSESPDELVIEYQLGDLDIIRVAVEPEPADVVEFKRELGLDLLAAGPGSSAAERARVAARFGDQRGYASEAQPEDAAETTWTVRLERRADSNSR
ncbi:MAG: hypothetical protein ACRDGI_11280 [Candidatus Limnocylindrales bacterium]